MKATHNRASGGTLIEVALAVLVLAVLALGASMAYQASWGQISVQRNKRAALVTANSRLEALRALDYSVIKPPDKDLTYYIDSNNALSTTDPDELIPVNDRDLPIKTTVWYVNADSSGLHDYPSAKVRVAVAYREATRDEDYVGLETVISP